jgi:molecular chaperone GrpE
MSMRKRKQSEGEFDALQEDQPETAAETAGVEGSEAERSDAAETEVDQRLGDEVSEGTEPASPEVEALKSELEAHNDRYLRLAAEFDNSRTRTIRERMEVRERAQADFARQLLETLDDLGRVAALEAENATVHDVIDGIHMVERKLLQELEQAGFERVGSPGESFDPNHHEAIATQPASGDSEAGTVGNVVQPGYRLGNVLLRPARVVVLVDTEQGGE